MTWSGLALLLGKRLTFSIDSVCLQTSLKLLCTIWQSTIFQADGKGGLSLRGVAFMTVLAVLTVLVVLENTLPFFCWSYKTEEKEATVTVLAVMTVSVVTATPLKLNPPFPSS